MHDRRVRVAVAVAVVAAAAAAAAVAAAVGAEIGVEFGAERQAFAAGPEIFPLSSVRPGQKGYGLTAFVGTQPERFDFEVVGVMRDFLPRMDIILVKSDDPRIVRTGFAQGMSGSPLYLDGKVVCAFSYGFRFNKEAIGGCTPIHYMLDEARQTTGQVGADPAAPVGPAGHAALASRDWDPFAAPLAPPTVHAPVGDLVRASVPLSVSGVDAQGLAELRDLFAPYGLEPQQAGGGGTGGENSGPTRFEPGSPIAVVLSRGDLSMVGTGTVSYVDGNRVLAFGHPMFQMGETLLPVTSAEIHTIIPSAQSAFKLSSPLRTLGALVQDRQSMILADTSRRAELIPVELTVKTPGGTRRFRSEVVRHRFLTPQLAMASVANGIRHIAPDLADATMIIDSVVHVRGFDPLRFRDHAWSPEGAAAGAVSGARGLRILTPLLFNPWAPVTVDRVEVTVEVTYRADVETLVGLRIPRYEVPVGKPVFVEAVLQPYAGRTRVVRIPFELPARLAGATLKLELATGDLARLDAAPPENLTQLFAALRRTYPANTLVATIYAPDEGIAVAGHLVPDLPDGALDTARAATSTKRVDSHRTLLRVVVPTSTVVLGKQELTFRVENL